MNKTYSISDMISLYYEREFAATDETVLPQFSVKHNKKIRKAFEIFARNNPHSTKIHKFEKTKRPLNFRQRIVIVVAIIAFMAIATGCVIAFFSNSFRGTVHTDNTYLFAVNADDCPGTIEKVYTLSVVPEGYELSETTTTFDSVMTIYTNDCGNQLIFNQMIKELYNGHVNTEGYTLEEISINDCNAVCIERKVEAGVSTLVIWDNKDYILELMGNFTKNEMVDLAISNENCGF